MTIKHSTHVYFMNKSFNYKDILSILEFIILILDFIILIENTFYFLLILIMKVSDTQKIHN